MVSLRAPGRRDGRGVVGLPHARAPRDQRHDPRLGDDERPGRHRDRGYVQPGRRGRYLELLLDSPARYRHLRASRPGVGVRARAAPARHDLHRDRPQGHPHPGLRPGPRARPPVLVRDGSQACAAARFRRAPAAAGAPRGRVPARRRRSGANGSPRRRRLDRAARVARYALAADAARSTRLSASDRGRDRGGDQEPPRRARVGRLVGPGPRADEGSGRGRVVRGTRADGGRGQGRPGLRRVPDAPRTRLVPRRAPFGRAGRAGGPGGHGRGHVRDVLRHEEPRLGERRPVGRSDRRRGDPDCRRARAGPDRRGRPGDARHAGRRPLPRRGTRRRSADGSRDGPGRDRPCRRQWF